MQVTRKNMAAFVAASFVAVLLAACGGGGNTDRNITEVVSFGDSLSDVGTYNPTTLDLDPTNDRPDGLKFTVNPAPIWSEIVAANYSFSLRPNKQVNFGSPVAFTTNGVSVPANGVIKDIGGTSYAQGGARIATDLTTGGIVAASQSIPWPTQQATALSIKTQIDNYLAARGSFNPHQVVLIQGGANDFFAFLGGVANSTIDPATAPAVISANVTAMITQINRLVAAGATKIVYANLPDLGATPQFRTTALAGLATTLSVQYNAAVAAAMPAGVVTYDVKGLFDKVIASPATYGLSNVTGMACDPAKASSSLVCSQSTLIAAGADRSYVFADGVHPTPAGHKLWGDAAAATALAHFAQ